MTQTHTTTQTLLILIHTQTHTQTHTQINTHTHTHTLTHTVHLPGWGARKRSTKTPWCEAESAPDNQKRKILVMDVIRLSSRYGVMSDLHGK